MNVMTAMQRDPLIAGMWLACGHRWQATFVGLVPTGCQTPCDCGR